MVGMNKLSGKKIIVITHKHPIPMEPVQINKENQIGPEFHCLFAASSNGEGQGILTCVL
jgi:hypothetical protein